MKKFALLAAVVAVPIVGVVLAQPPEPGDAQPGSPALPPPPGEHHRWLDQLVGVWTIESEMQMEGQEPFKLTGTETVRSLGGRWVTTDMKSDVPGMGSLVAVMTLGYNPETGKYQGTWVDSVTDHLWVYEGTLDATRTILTLEADGPNMMDPAQGSTRYRDVIEIKSADHRTLSSSALVDGEWVSFGSSNYRRAK